VRAEVFGRQHGHPEIDESLAEEEMHQHATLAVAMRRLDQKANRGHAWTGEGDGSCDEMWGERVSRL
jgi:hypothetical protein